MSFLNSLCLALRGSFEPKDLYSEYSGSVGSDWRERESWVGGSYSVFDYVMATQA